MFSVVKARLREEDGIALIVALNVMIVAIALSLLVAWVAVSTNADSGVDRQRAVSVNAAEAGLDSAFVALQSMGSSTNPLPCTGSTTNLGNLTINVPDQPVVTRTISYTDMSGQPIDCATLAANAQKVPVRAVITATANPVALAGATQKRTRVMQALVTLRPVLQNGFDNAIFANSALTVQNNHTVNGNVGDDANIYSNGNVTCPNGALQQYHGNIYAQGAVSFSGNCSVSGDIWANNAVTLGGNNTTVGGRVISSTSSVSVSNLGGVSGNIMAATTISPTSCGSPKCTRGLVQSAPPAQTFPRIDKSLVSQWADAGYDVQTYTGTCANIVSALQNTYAKTGHKTLVMTSCSVSFSSTDLNLYNDLVIFADGGFQASQQVNMNSADGAQHLLYWIVPADTTVTCASPSSTTWQPGDIYTGNKFAVNSPVQMMMYTPCNADIQNHSDQFGQIYAGGTATVDNNFDMDFRPLPVVGIDPASQSTLYYKVDITYKREVRG